MPYEGSVLTTPACLLRSSILATVAFAAVWIPGAQSAVVSGPPEPQAPSSGHNPHRVPFEDLVSACATTNPYFATTIFNRERGPNSPAVVEFRYLNAPGGAETLATHEQVGAVYGMATSPYDWDVYVGAFLKRGSPFGPGGAGQIYRINAVSGAVEPFVRVIGAETDQHDPTDGYWPDDAAIRHVGRSSLGDIDRDRADMYAMSLRDRRIYHYRMSGPAMVGSYDIGSSGELWAVDARPFALKVFGNRLYHGVVNSAQSTGDRSQMTAHVYQSTLFGAGMREVLRFRLDYPRQHAIANVPAEWQAWRDDVVTVDTHNTHGVYPQPILADIEFADDGSMIVALRDRYGDMAWDNPLEGMPPGEYPAVAPGDIFRARVSGSSWQLDPTTEFFRRDAGPGYVSDGVQDEIAVGGLARVHTADVTVAMGMSVLRVGAGGALWFENPSGDNPWRQELYSPDASVLFQKANGHGDVERLCGPIPPPEPPPALPTRIPSVTPTPTTTRTPTATATASVTLTPEPTATPVPTGTSTRIPTSTSTNTAVPTVTASPSRTATASSTPLPTPSATRRTRYTIYLPFNWRPSSCRFQSRPIDVALVLDRSTSMLRSVEPGGLPKNAAAVAAARRFVGLLRLDGGAGADRVAVVGFNDMAWTEAPLTARRDVAEAALARIEGKTAEGTRLDLAFQMGAASLGAGASDRTRVMIVLTDGLPNRVPTPAPSGSEEETVLWAATVAKSEGVRVFTIGLGEPSDILVGLLSAAASSPADYYYAPDPSQLGAIYETIAGVVRVCP